MSLPIKWSKFTRENLDKFDPVYGVYELGDESGDVIYIGQGVLSERLWSHVKNKKKAHYFRCQKTGSKLRAEQRERAEINAYERKYSSLPVCNKRREYPPHADWWE